MGISKGYESCRVRHSSKIGARMSAPKRDHQRRSGEKETPTPARKHHATPMPALRTVRADAACTMLTDILSIVCHGACVDAAAEPSAIRWTRGPRNKSHNLAATSDVLPLHGALARCLHEKRKTRRARRWLLHWAEKRLRMTD